MSTASAHYEEASGLRTSRLLPERLARKSGLLAQMLGEFGVRRTAHIVLDSKLRDPPSETEFTHRNPSLFRQPIRMTTSLTDVGTMLEIGRRQVYDLPDRLSRRVEGHSIVDIGAHIGLSAVYFASRYQESEVLAVEPDSRNYHYLWHNSKPYDGQISPLHRALAPRSGRASRSTPAGMPARGHPIYQYLEEADVHSAGDIQTLAISPEVILSYVKDGIGLLKVDIEGAEKALYESGSMDGILEATEIMAIETHDRFIPGSTTMVDEAARRAGLRAYQTDNDHTQLYVRP